MGVSSRCPWLDVHRSDDPAGGPDRESPGDGRSDDRAEPWAGVSTTGTASERTVDVAERESQ
jgi:hypothetical protein